MKKMLTLLTVAMITASLTGCGSCRRCCPWLDRGAYCGSPTPWYAPLAATAPAMMPAYQPYQYTTPLAATAPNACCPAPAPQQQCCPQPQQCCPQPQQCCSSWDPCQGQVNYSYAPTAGYAPAAGQAPCCGQPGYPAMAPMGQMVAPMSYGGEPGCAYEPSFGGPYMGGMSYGPVMSGGCDTCGTGYSGATGSPSPTVVMPAPGD